MSDCWLQTYTGKAAFPLNLQPEQVCLEDIAHSLSLICRFNGHCRFHYSVAQHAVLMSDELCRRYGKLTALAGLHHDDEESLTCDIPRPLKAVLEVRDDDAVEEDRYRTMSTQAVKIRVRMFEALGLMAPFATAHPDLWERVKEADDRMVMTEARDIMSRPPMPWDVDAKPYKARIFQMSPEQAEKLFLQRHKELMS